MNWDLKGCSGKCIICGKDFIDGEIFYCRLFLEQDGPVREDYCKDCWVNRVDLDKGYSMWRGRYKLEPEEVEEPIQEPILKQMLRKYLHSEERLYKCFCYILAILLERNKTFRPRPKVSSSDGKEQLVYEDRETGETFILDDPGLTLKELSQIESQLQEVIRQEFGRV